MTLRGNRGRKNYIKLISLTIDPDNSSRWGSIRPR